MRFHRLLVAVFVVLVASSSFAVPAPQAATQRFYFDNYSLVYPTSYMPQGLPAGTQGCYLIRTAPFACVFVAMQRKGEDTVVPQGRAILSLMLGRLSAGNQITSQTVEEIPASQLKSPITLGRIYRAHTSRGLTLEARLYLSNVSGKKALVGYATLTGTNVPPDIQPLLTTDAAAVAAEFDQIAASIKLETASRGY